MRDVSLFRPFSLLSPDSNSTPLLCDWQRRHPDSIVGHNSDDLRRPPSPLVVSSRPRLLVAASSPPRGLVPPPSPPRDLIAPSSTSSASPLPLHLSLLSPARFDQAATSILVIVSDPSHSSRRLTPKSPDGGDLTEGSMGCGSSPGSPSRSPRARRTPPTIPASSAKPSFLGLATAEPSLRRNLLSGEAFLRDSSPAKLSLATLLRRSPHLLLRLHLTSSAPDRLPLRFVASVRGPDRETERESSLSPSVHGPDRETERESSLSPSIRGPDREGNIKLLRSSMPHLRHASALGFNSPRASSKIQILATPPSKIKSSSSCLL